MEAGKCCVAAHVIPERPSSGATYAEGEAERGGLVAKISNGEAVICTIGSSMFASEAMGRATVCGSGRIAI